MYLHVERSPVVASCCPTIFSRYRSSLLRVLLIQYALLPYVIFGRFMCLSVFFFFLKRKGGREGGRRAFFFLRRGKLVQHTCIATLSNRKPKQAPNMFCIGLHFVLFGRRMFHFVFVSNCTTFLLLGAIMILLCIGLHFGHNLNTHTIVSSISTGKPQPQHGLWMGSLAQNSSIIFRK